MLLKISTRSVDDVTIVDLDGRIIFGEECAALRDLVRNLLKENKKKILLNMAEVRYIDSGGNGTLVVAWDIARKEKGALKFVNLPPKIHELFQIAKLYSIYEVFADEGSAIRSFSSPRLRCYCPVCGSLAVPQDDSQVQACGRCNLQFTVSYSSALPRQTVLISIRIQTYQGEQIEVSCGKVFVVRVVGRLDPFSFPTLGKVWKSIPLPRRALVDLSRVTEVDSSAANSLIVLLEEGKQDGTAGISVEGLGTSSIRLFHVAPPVYSTRNEALKAIEGHGDAPQWTVAIDSQ